MSPDHQFDKGDFVERVFWRKRRVGTSPAKLLLHSQVFNISTVHLSSFLSHGHGLTSGQVVQKMPVNFFSCVNAAHDGTVMQ
jgi:hypothetical protein